MIHTLLMDSMIILLLIGAISYCWKLNGRLNSLKEINFNLQPALQALNQYVTKMSDSLGQMRQEMRQTKEILQNDVPKAQHLKMDLEMMLQYCETAHQKLETLIEESRHTQADLDQTFQVVAKTFPKNFKETIQNSSTSIDFDMLKSQSMNNLEEWNGSLVLPQKIEPNTGKEWYIDEQIIKNMGNLH
ncbi:MAG: hypothetical protein KBD31_05505 [Proteobacteria bacterium]|nr:hypothetical protein [Pseudomonadota bacterium]